MNPYVIGGGVAIIAVMGFLLKNSYERNGELEAKLATQAAETQEAADANETNLETIDQLRLKINELSTLRRTEAAEREKVLVEREAELARAVARADRLEQEREHEIDTNPDCADLTSLSLDLFCPATAAGLRSRTGSTSSNGDGNH